MTFKTLNSLLKASASLAVMLNLSCTETPEKPDLLPAQCLEDEDFGTKSISKEVTLGAVGQGNCGDYFCLDVTIRDFPVDRYGFEMFDGNERGAGVCAGSNQGGSVTTNDVSPQTNYKNAICFDGDRYRPCGDSDTKCLDCGSNHLKYGEGVGIRGYCNGPDAKTGGCGDWSNSVFVTKGMVQNELAYDPAYCEEWDLTDKIGCEVAAAYGLTPCPNYIKYRKCAFPKKGNGHCYGEDVESWFRDGDRDHARVFRDIMVLLPVGKGNGFEINYDANTRNNWNGYGVDAGFFPLDKYEINNTNDIYGSPSFGMQSINEWCPNNSGTAICRQWYDAGGPKVGTAARQAVGNSPKLHNYGFSMTSSVNFKYEAGKSDIFEFIGDDDMWIFVDGLLVPEGDLGGTHLAAPARIWIDEYAQRMAWENGSSHVINFFYLDRNTDGSNMKLKLALTDIDIVEPKPPVTPPTPTSEPKILNAKTKFNGDKSRTVIFVDKELNEEYLRSMSFPFVVKEGNIEKPYAIESFKLDLECSGTSMGYKYIITGERLNPGSISLNLGVRSKNGIEVTEYSWVPIN